MSTTQPERPVTRPQMIEIDLLKTLARVIRAWKLIAGLAVLGFLAGTALGFWKSNVYTAEALFLPPTPSAPTSNATNVFTGQDPNDVYLGMLRSRTVADAVIDANHLMERFHPRYRMDARTLLGAMSKFNIEQNSLISVQVTTADPQLSAAIANSYLDALYHVNGQMSASSSGHRSQFFEQQLNAESEQLAEAETDLKEMQEKTGTVLPENEAQAGLTATARLEAGIQDAQAQLSSLLTSSTEQNPAVVRLRAQIAALQAQLRRQQLSEKPAPGSGIASNARLPSVLLDYARKSRELRQRETLYETLTADYEKARLASLDPGPQLQVIDYAKAPERKSGPSHKLYAMVGLVTGGLLGLFLVLLRRPFAFVRERYRAAALQVERS